MKGPGDRRERPARPTAFATCQMLADDAEDLTRRIRAAANSTSGGLRVCGLDLVGECVGRICGFAGAVLTGIGFSQQIHQRVRLFDYLVGREGLHDRLEVGDHVARDDEEAPHVGTNRLVLLARERNSLPAWTRGAFAQVELLGALTMSLFPS